MQTSAVAAGRYGVFRQLQGKPCEAPPESAPNTEDQTAPEHGAEQHEPPTSGSRIALGWARYQPAEHESHEPDHDDENPDAGLDQPRRWRRWL